MFLLEKYIADKQAKRAKDLETITPQPAHLIRGLRARKNNIKTSAAVVHCENGNKGAQADNS